MLLVLLVCFFLLHSSLLLSFPSSFPLPLSLSRSSFPLPLLHSSLPFPSLFLFLPILLFHFHPFSATPLLRYSPTPSPLLPYSPFLLSHLLSPPGPFPLPLPGWGGKGRGERRSYNICAIFSPLFNSLLGNKN